MTDIAAPAPTRRAYLELTAWTQMLAHALVSRLIFDGAFILGGLFRLGNFKVMQNYPLPDAAVVNGLLARSARNYGDYDWYWSILLRGYDKLPFNAQLEHNWAFFPLQAIAIRLVERPGFQFIVGHLAFFASVCLLFDYLRRTLDAETARRTVILLVYFPFSFCIAQFRPEAFLLLFSALALWLAQRGRRWDGALAAAVAGLAKPNAFLLSLLLTPNVWPRPPASFKDAAARLTPGAVALLAAPASGIVFMTWYLAGRTGEPLAWAKIQAAWGAKLGVVPIQQFQELLHHPMLAGRNGWDPMVLHWMIFVVFLACVAWLIGHRRYVYALYATLYVGLTFSNFGVFVLGKHLSTCFPAFVGLALLVRGGSLFSLATAASAALLAMNGLMGGMGFDFLRA